MFLDIAIGIITSIFISNVYSIDLTTQLLISGIIFNLLPDLDAIISLLKNNEKFSHYHRDLFHKPIIFIILGILIYFYLSQPLGLLFILNTLAHFVHDSIGIGWGVQWLWPFNKNHYAFFYLYSLPHKKIPRKLIYCWTHKELPDVVKEYGDEDWIRNIYFKFHPYAIIEYISLILTIFILVRYYL